ncbi:MAG: lysylphosphatidylglycerol synthase domain-containing protein [Alphaproteobacteria bacterium]|nr:lysylphosphatidylglycerol synthase domain-containing protein [Alphaproteobacteria bacterium]
MLRWAALLGLLGLAGATALIVYSGWGEVVQALAVAGWGIVFVALFHLLSIATSSAGWRVLVAGKSKPSWGAFFYFMWVRAAINNLMPVARIGGEVAAVKLMTARGMKREVAIGATVAELTLSIAAIFLFVVIGVAMLALRVNGSDAVRQFAWGVGLTLPVIVALAAVQKIGFFGLMLRLFRLMFRDKWAHLAGDAVRLDDAVGAMYRHHARAFGCFALQFAAWSLGAVEIWISLRFLGHPLPFNEAVMIEAVVQGSASAAFAIPAALGVQEAGFLFFGEMLGLPPGIAAALAVMRRCRDLLCYAPALILWQAQVGKKLLR